MSAEPSPGQARLQAALSQACQSLEAAAASSREDWAAHGAELGACELMDWTEEIEAALREVGAALRELPGKSP